MHGTSFEWPTQLCTSKGISQCAATQAASAIALSTAQPCPRTPEVQMGTFGPCLKNHRHHRSSARKSAEYAGTGISEVPEAFFFAVDLVPILVVSFLLFQ